MGPVLEGVLALAAAPIVLALLGNHLWLMRAVALGVCALPFLLTPAPPLFRSAAALVTWLFLVKTLQFAAGHEKPLGFVDRLQFLTIPAVVRWETPRRKDPGRAIRTLLRAGLQLGLALLLALAVLQLDRTNRVQLITTQIGIYLCLAAACNLAVITLAVRGLDYDDPFDNPLAARTPGEFWGRRWNTWVNHMLYRYVFVPSGGWRRPVRGTLAAFAASAAIHEGLVIAGTREVSGWMGSFFLVQGVLVAATSQSRSFRQLARRVPALTWGFTLAVMLATGILLVRGAEGIDPSEAWRRCCR